MDAESPIRLFVSYSHDSASHDVRVLEIAQRLRHDGIDCDLDQFVVGSPPEGWPRWMKRKLFEADFVLVVCTETYSRRFDSTGLLDSGLGARWEAFLLTQEIYESGGVNSKYVPVIFTEQDRKHVPAPLRPVSYYLLPDQYSELYRFITRQPRVVPNPVGTHVLLVPAGSTGFPPVANAPFAASGADSLPIVSPVVAMAFPLVSIEELDVRLTDPTLRGNDRSDLLLKKAILLQKLGRVAPARHVLAQYERTVSCNELPDFEYLICKGKLIAQNRDYRALRDYMDHLDLDKRFRTTDGEHQLSPLLWRLGLLTRLPSSPESERYLKRHGSIVTISDYQHAHNQQCIAFADILDSSHPGGLSHAVKTAVEQTLHDAYLGYLSVDRFVYQDKCLASNLAMLGVLYLQTREPRRAFEHLLHARLAFQTLGVQPGHEAMAEITGLIKEIFPEAYELLFGNLATIIPHHSQGDLLRELYGDVSRFWSQMRPDRLPGIVSHVYSSLIR